MNQKELGEIRRRFRPDHNNIQHIYGCYVNTNKEIITSFDESLGLLSQTETEKYLTLLKKALSGALGKNLLDISFATRQVMDGEEYKLLSALRKSELQDPALREAFCRCIIDSIDMEDRNYLILLAYDVYDVPHYGKDGSRDDEGGELYKYLVCAVCPVKQEKSALRYNPEDNLFRGRAPEWTAAAPALGFLFPLYEGGSADVNTILLFSRDSNDAHEAFLQAAFHLEAVMPAAEQMENFQTLLAQSLGTECYLEVVQEMHETFSDLIADQGKDDEPLMLSKQDMARVLEEGGVSEERVEAFRNGFDATFGEGAVLPAVNVVTPKQFRVDLPSVSIKVDPKQADLLETRVIDGRSYLLIPIDGDISVNGQPVFTKLS
jgi:hypothetical protein